MYEVEIDVPKNAYVTHVGRSWLFDKLVCIAAVVKMTQERKIAIKPALPLCFCIACIRVSNKMNPFHLLSSIALI
ncbi:hypothetical protein C9E85_11990 [Plesiomonas shigelloides]|nr:hypothetical protein C9E85_11990 [Plesiomonas shigelloides]